MPWLAGWRYGELDPTLRKSFEVALHGGTAAALLLRPAGPRPPRWRRVAFAACAAGAMPPALVGYTLGGPIERRLGHARHDRRRPARRLGRDARRRARPSRRALRTERVATRRRGTRATTDRSTRARAAPALRDGLALGLAQALALMPGVSRSGATLAAARAAASRAETPTGSPGRSACR